MLAKNTIKNQKDTLSQEIITKIINKVATSENILEIHNVVLILLGFSGFMRISELLPLKVKHVNFTESGTKIYIEKSKVDQLREGNTIFISRLDSDNCPVYWLNRYLNLSFLTRNLENYIFSRLFKTKNGRKANGAYSISYTTALDSLSKHPPDSVDPRSFGTHSLRSGGASAAANENVSDRLISKHGRWASGRSRDRYIKNNKQKRFEISKKLGLWNYRIFLPVTFCILAYPQENHQMLLKNLTDSFNVSITTTIKHDHIV